MKKLLLLFFAAAMLFSLTVTAAAQEDDMYYNEYDNYDEFEQDYYNSVGSTKEDDAMASFNFSPIPPIAGIATGATVVFVLHRRHTLFARRAPEPHPERIKSVHTVTNTNTL